VPAEQGTPCVAVATVEVAPDNSPVARAESQAIVLHLVRKVGKGDLHVGHMVRADDLDIITLDQIGKVDTGQPEQEVEQPAPFFRTVLLHEFSLSANQGWNEGKGEQGTVMMAGGCAISWRCVEAWRGRAPERRERRSART